MTFQLQPTISNNLVTIRPLTANDFDSLFEVAGDPLIWEQHPNKNRYQRAEFENYFKGAIESGGAFLVSDAQTGKVIGSSRFYGWNETNKIIFLGYTFLARSHWGSQYNPVIKQLLLNHAFQYADAVLFHVGAYNIRSQKAMERLGAVKLEEKKVAYYGEPLQDNFVYLISKQNWPAITSQ